MAGNAGRAPVWLFDMDDTLHDASWRVFPAMNRAMTDYIRRHLGLDRAAADSLRQHFWRRYGATLLGLVHEHGVDSEHFLAETHRFANLFALLRADPGERRALRQLPGRKLVLTNAPRAYARQVLRHFGLLKAFDAVISVEDMVQFGRLRPKPDTRMLRHVLQRHGLRPQQCVLVEDTPGHLRAARRIGMRGVWYTRYGKVSAQRGRCAYLHARIGSLWRLRKLRQCSG